MVHLIYLTLGKLDPMALYNNEIELAIKAGGEILSRYKDASVLVTTKADDSPLSSADLASHNVITRELSQMSSWPILSEESLNSDVSFRQSWDIYWLVDPLDGTKEFLKGNGEFTVNIALIENHQPVFGVVHAPVLGVTYWGAKGVGAFKRDKSGTDTAIRVRARPTDQSDWIVVGSRSHQSDDFKHFMQRYPQASIVSMGSSLKLCLVAEGKADLYPRLGLTSEWDTAAAQAVVEAAGGVVVSWPGLEPLRCNTHLDSLLNPFFIVGADPLPSFA